MDGHRHSMNGHLQAQVGFVRTLASSEFSSLRRQHVLILVLLNAILTQAIVLVLGRIPVNSSVTYSFVPAALRERMTLSASSLEKRQTRASTHVVDCRPVATPVHGLHRAREGLILAYHGRLRARTQIRYTIRVCGRRRGQHGAERACPLREGRVVCRNKRVEVEGRGVLGGCICARMHAVLRRGRFSFSFAF